MLQKRPGTGPVLAHLPSLFWHMAACIQVWQCTLVPCYPRVTPTRCSPGRSVLQGKPPAPTFISWESGGSVFTRRVPEVFVFTDFAAISPRIWLNRDLAGCCPDTGALAWEPPARIDGGNTIPRRHVIQRIKLPLAQAQCHAHQRCVLLKIWQWLLTRRVRFSDYRIPKIKHQVIQFYVTFQPFSNTNLKFTSRSQKILPWPHIYLWLYDEGNPHIEIS